MTDGPSYRHYGSKDLDPVLESSVVDLTQLPVVEPSSPEDRALPSRGAAPADEIARNNAVAHIVLDQVEAMLNRKPTQQGGNNNE